MTSAGLQRPYLSNIRLGKARPRNRSNDPVPLLVKPELMPQSQHDPDREIVASIIENSDDAIISKRLDGTMLSWNRAAERLFGYRRDEMIGQSILRIIPKNRLHEEKDILRRLSNGERIDHYETVRRCKDGRTIEVSVSISPVRNGSGQIIGACKIARDITERKRVEANLREGEQLMRAILDTAADAIITINEHGIIQSANAATGHLFGYGASELIGQNINVLMPEPFHSEHNDYLRNYLRTGYARIIGIGREVTGLRKDGVTFPMHLAVGEVQLAGRRLFTGIVHDLSERRNLERQIIEAATGEQRRIGQDLHDGLCQDLIGIAYSIDDIRSDLPIQASAAVGSLKQVAASVRTAATQARDLSHGLNPVDVRAGGLPTALENLTSRVSKSFGIRCKFIWDRIAQVPDDTTATHLYRITQEAISNAIKHGKAKTIQVSLTAPDGELVLSVSDNGKGISPPVRDGIKHGLPLAGRMMPHGAGPGIGLQTMQYRARVINGTFSAGPRKGGGTIVSCIFRRDLQSTNSRRKTGGVSENPAHPKRMRSR